MKLETHSLEYVDIFNFSIRSLNKNMKLETHSLVYVDIFKFCNYKFKQKYEVRNP